MEPNQTNPGNNVQFNQSPVAPASAPTPAVDQNAGSGKKIGPVMAILVIVLVLIMAGLYIFASRVNQTLPTDATVVGNDADDLVGLNTVPAVKEITNKADDIQSLQSDLEASVEGLNNI